MTSVKHECRYKSEIGNVLNVLVGTGSDAFKITRIKDILNYPKVIDTS